MTGIEAQADVGDIEQPLDVLGSLHDRAVVWVHGHAEPTFAGRGHHAVDPLPERAPSGGIQPPGSLVALPAGRRREDEHAAAERRDRLRRGIDPRELSLEGRRVVQDRGDESRHEGEAVRVEERALRAAGQEPVRTELRRTEPEGSHLGEHALGRHLVAPPGHLADPPGDRRARHALGEIRHATSSSRTGRCSSRERSHATATRIASNASSAVQGLCRRPAATSTNAGISAR